MKRDSLYYNQIKTREHQRKGEKKMTIREMIETLEAIAQEHGDDTLITLDQDTGLEEISSVDFHQKDSYFGAAWRDMVVIQ